jgi:copper chaperone CopZ/cytochrome c biogenesis protein CcdA
MERVTFLAPNITCPGCAQTIHDALREVRGVQNVEVDVSRRQVAVSYDPRAVGPGEIRRRLVEAGFPPPEERAPAAEAPPAPPTAPAHRPQREAALPPAAPTAPRWLWYLLLALGVAVLALAGYIGYVLYSRFALPAVTGAGLLVLAAAAGVASFFSSCSFPLLVTLVARETGVEAAAAHPPLARALGFAAALAVGAVAFMLLVGLVIALGGSALLAGVTFASPAGIALRTVVGFLLLVLGLIQTGLLRVAFPGAGGIVVRLRRFEARVRRVSPTLGFGLFGFGYVLAGFG